MSKLADAIRRSQRIESAPMGFGAARAEPRPSMLVGYFGAEGDAPKARDAGADFLLIDARNGSVDPAKLRDAAGELPLGAWTTAQDSAAAKALREGGIDFLVVAEDSPAASLLDDDLGYVLALPSQPEEAFLRSLEPLSLEALLLHNIPSPLTVAGELELGRTGALARRSMLCETAASASADDLQCLRAAGVAGVMTDAGGIAQLKETVKSLPQRKARGENRAVVSLPRGQAAAAEGEDDDDDRVDARA
jgi:hypothetical protein